MTDVDRKDNPISKLLAAGWSRYGIAKAGGWAIRTVQFWENGWYKPNPENQAKLKELEAQGGPKK